MTSLAKLLGILSIAPIIFFRTRKQSGSNSHRKAFRINKLPFLDCLVKVENDGSLFTTVYRKSTHTDQHLYMFDSFHPLIHNLGVIKTLFHRVDIIPSTAEAKISEQDNLKSALANFGYRRCIFENKHYARVRNPKDYLRIPPTVKPPLHAKVSTSLVWEAWQRN